MTDIAALLQLNFSTILLGVFVILAGIKGITTLLEWTADKFGIETKWMRNRKEERKLLIKTASKLTELERQRSTDVENSIKHDEAIRDDLNKLTMSVDAIDKKLDCMEEKNNYSEMVKLKDTLVNYFKKYKDAGEWSQFENDSFWDLFYDYEGRGGDGYIHTVVEPVMRELKIID